MKKTSLILAVLLGAQSALAGVYTAGAVATGAIGNSLQQAAELATQLYQARTGRNDDLVAGPCLPWSQSDVENHIVKNPKTNEEAIANAAFQAAAKNEKQQAFYCVFSVMTRVK